MEQVIPSRKRVSEEEYLRLEHDATEKHEYHDGVIVAMAGGSPQHSRITVNILSFLNAKLGGSRCSVYDSNLKVRTVRPRKYHYPDAMVICGDLQFPSEEDQRSVVNPKLIVEVLSPSTAGYDATEKFTAYMSLDSFEEYVLISQTEPRVETRRRQSDGTWIMRFASGEDAIIHLASVGIDLPLAEVYANVNLPPLLP